MAEVSQIGNCDLHAISKFIICDGGFELINVPDAVQNASVKFIQEGEFIPLQFIA